MTEVAGEVADGIIVHAFTTEKYLRETTIPAIERGLAKSGRTRDDFEISYPCFVVTGRDEKEQAGAAQATRQQIAFYGSTPAYKPVLDSVGAGELQPQLNAMSKQGRWVEMAELIDEDLMRNFAVVAEPDDIATGIKDRYGDIVDRTSAAYAQLDGDRRRRIVEALTA